MTIVSAGACWSSPGSPDCGRSAGGPRSRSKTMCGSTSCMSRIGRSPWTCTSWPGRSQRFSSGVARTEADPRSPGMKVALVCSSGGHLAQLHRLEPWWRRHDRTWVTFRTPDAESLLAGQEIVVWAHHPTTRSIPNLLRNLRLAWRVLRRDRPDLGVSDGAGVGL